MAIGVLMPKAGITVETCMITRWEKKVGDIVNIGDILFSYETDKAVFECESTAEGELLEIFFAEGDEVPVLVNVCALGKRGEDVTPLRPGGEKADEETDNAAAAAAEESPSGTAPAADIPEKHDGAVKMSPRAKNLAERIGVNPGHATPSGPYGRVIEQDIRALSESARGSGIGGKVLIEDIDTGDLKNNKDAAVSPSLSANEYTDIKFSKIRSAIAQAMSNSLAATAQLTHHHSFDATSILSLRKGLKENAERLRLPNITLNDFILYAVSRTLLNHPDLNAHIVDGNILRRFKEVHLGIAIDTPRGLMVPTIFYANRKSLTEIAAEAKDLAKQAQSGTINPDLLQGGTFTVSNLGALGVEMFTPVLNPPQTGILGVCNITTRFRETGGEYKPYPAMGLSVTYDHRAVDGAPEARFAQELVSNLENFSILLVK